MLWLTGVRKFTVDILFEDRKGLLFVVCGRGEDFSSSHYCIH